ncbi:MAG: acyltransferase family protein [Parvibaculales bacterium]
MNYRSDIDGLRAFAVLSVVVFHAFPGRLTGGFIGVDIFFVISGFLISHIILSDIQNKSFKLTEFYIRRVQRIFPSLLVVMIVSIFFGSFLLLSDEFSQLGKHIASGASFIVNFVLVTETGYFDNAAETKPMLHLWSLAVEEQFYLIWPLMLLLVAKRSRNLLILTFIISIASFVYNIQIIASNPSEAFFWPFGRFWELLTGAILAWFSVHYRKQLDLITPKVNTFIRSAIYVDQWQPSENAFASLLSIGGFCLLLWGVFNIHKGVGFPGYWAAVPVLGASLIISAGPSAIVNKWLLSNRVAIWIGLISYPLYLWHWPILSALYIVKDGQPDRNARLIGVFLSFLLAWITYRFIEKPVRFNRRKHSTVISLVVLMIATGLVGYSIFIWKGFPERELRDGLSHHDVLKITELNHGLAKECAPDISFAKEQCATSESPKALLWGDSYAMHLAQALNSSPTELGFRQQTMSLCAPVLDYVVYVHWKRSEWYDECIQHNRNVIQWLQENKGIEYVIMASPFSFNKEGIVEGEKVTMNEGIYLQQLRLTIETIVKIGKKPIVIGPPPWSGFDTGGCWKRKFPRQLEHECNFTQTQSTLKVNNRLDNISDAAPTIKLRDYICDSTGCRATIDELALFRDSGHLSKPGSARFGASIDFAGKIKKAADQYKYQ